MAKQQLVRDLLVGDTFRHDDFQEPAYDVVEAGDNPEEDMKFRCSWSDAASAAEVADHEGLTVEELLDLSVEVEVAEKEEVPKAAEETANDSKV